MIDSVKPVKTRRNCSGSGTLLCQSRGPFFLGARERRALAKLICGQRDAFWEAETGTPRSGEPFTLGDLAELEPLLGWLNQQG